MSISTSTVCFLRNIFSGIRSKFWSVIVSREKREKQFRDFSDSNILHTLLKSPFPPAQLTRIQEDTFLLLSVPSSNQRLCWHFHLHCSFLFWGSVGCTLPKAISMTLHSTSPAKVKLQTHLGVVSPLSLPQTLFCLFCTFCSWLELAAARETLSKIHNWTLSAIDGDDRTGICMRVLRMYMDVRGGKCFRLRAVGQLNIFVVNNSRAFNAMNIHQISSMIWFYCVFSMTWQKSPPFLGRG